MPWRESAAELGRARAEQPVIVSTPAGALYGIFTPPAPEVPAANMCAVLFTRPRLHRNRMWVEAARRLAARGFACFRFDYHGTGDSEGESAFLDPNRPYRHDATTVIRYLRENLGQRRFVLSGLCFDARTALSALVDEGDAVAGIVFIAAPVMELETMAKVDADRRSWRQVGFAVLKRENWRAMLKPKRWRHVITVLGRMVRRRLGRMESDHPLAESFVEHFQALVRSEARALFLYGAEDTEYGTFRAAERMLFTRLPRKVRERFDIEVWPGAVHAGTLDTVRQREILDVATNWIMRLHGASGDGRAGGGMTWTSR